MPDKLGDICNLLGGYAYSSADFSNIGIPVVKIGDVTGGGCISYTSMQRIPKNIAQQTNRFRTEARDTLIAMTGANVGKTSRVGTDDPEARINQRVGKFIPIPHLGYSKDYIHFLVCSTGAYRYFANSAYGSAQPNISASLIEKLPVPDLGPGEANRIGSILVSLDDKIELNRRMNETLEAMARAIFKDWFVDFGPTRAKMVGRAPYLASDIWSLFPDRLDADGRPEGWISSTIGQEAEVVGGSTPSTKDAAFWGGDISWATPKDLSSLSTPVLLSTERQLTAAGLSQIGSGLLPVGTVLLSSRAPIGYMAIAEVPVAVNQGFIAMICEKRLSNVFVWLWTQANMETVHQNANGSTFQEISKANFRPIEVTVAPPELLRVFDDTIKPLFDRIVSNEKEICTLAATRDFLLPKLMSGEARVDDAASFV